MASTITAGNATNNGTSISSDNTGILQIKTGTGSGTTVMTLDAVGAVGIGTASPSYPLDVTGTTRLNGVVGINGTPVTTASLLVSQGGADFTLGTNYATFFSGNGYSGGIALNATSMQIGQNSASRSLTFHSGTSFAERMRIDSAGNVGIGTSSPTTQLDLTRTVTGGAGLSFQANNPDTGASSASYVLAKQGSVSTGIYSYGNSGSYIGAITNNFAAFITNNTERMRIDTSGNVGIGTSSPSVRLDIVGSQYWRGAAAAGAVGIMTPDPTSGANGVNLAASFATGGYGPLTFSTAATERMRIDSSGNVGIGTTTPLLTAAGRGNMTVNGSSASIVALGVANSWFGYVFASGSAVDLASNSAPVTVTAGGANYVGFNTNGSERMRIDSSGNLLINTTSTIGGKCVIENTSANQLVLSNKDTGASAQYAAYFLRNNSIVGSIQTTNVATSYVTSSDYRLKKDIAPMQNALATVAQLKPVTYKWKTDSSEGQGFIAHELQSVVPEAVVGEKDAVDAEGNPVYQGIDTSFLVATLTAAIQELKAELDVCKAEIAALKGAK